MKILSKFKKAKVLNKVEQKSINGGSEGTTPIGPLEPIGTGGGYGGSSIPFGVCVSNLPILRIPCNTLCPDGTAPLCAQYDW